MLPPAKTSSATSAEPNKKSDAANAFSLSRGRGISRSRMLAAAAGRADFSAVDQTIADRLEEPAQAFGHVAYFGVGAYLCGILTKTYSLPFVVAFPAEVWAQPSSRSFRVISVCG
jgi:hypothetical protein